MELRFFLLYWHLYQFTVMEKIVVILFLLTLFFAGCKNNKTNKEDVFMPYVKDSSAIEVDTLALQEAAVVEFADTVPQNRGVDLSQIGRAHV